VQSFLGKNHTEGDHLEDLGVDGRIPKYVLIAVGLVGVDFIHLTYDRDQW
jgi:hypothetical protein